MKFVKNNNKGFMLVEVIVVTVVVVIIMTTLYLAFNRVYNAYETKEKYTNIDAIYAIKIIEDYMIDEIKLSKLIDDFNDSSNYYKEIKCSDTNVFSDESLCKSVFTQYKVNGLFLMKKDTNNTLSSLPDKYSDGVSVVNQTFKDYITYLNNAIINADTSDYVFVVETNTLESDNTILNKYAYLEIK